MKFTPTCNYNLMFFARTEFNYKICIMVYHVWLEEPKNIGISAPTVNLSPTFITANIFVFAGIPDEKTFFLYGKQKRKLLLHRYRSEFWLLVNYRNYFILRTFSNWIFLVSLFKQHNLMGCHPLSCRVSQMSPFCPVKMSILHASQRNPFIGVYQ